MVGVGYGDSLHPILIPVNIFFQSFSFYFAAPNKMMNKTLMTTAMIRYLQSESVPAAPQLSVL